jgi:DNA polymerase
LSAGKLSRDYETRSIVDLKKAGAYRYMAHPTTSVWCVSYAIDEQPVGLWVPGQPVPPAFIEAAANGAEAWAWNCAFERTVERYIMAPRHGFPEFALTNQRCTMVAAKEMGLPASLELAAPAVSLPIAKDTAGRRIMLKMAKPRKVEFADGWTDIPFDAVRVQEMDAAGWEVYETPAGEHIARVRWWNEPDETQTLFEYCKQDTEVERGVGNKLRPMKASELAAWHLDQTINDRGVLVDQNLASAATRIVNKVATGFDAEMKRLTNFAVPKCSAVAKIVAYLDTLGVKTPSLAKEDLARLLADDTIPAAARAVLELRKEAAKASVKKIKALLGGVSPEDGRAKGMLQFFAASTGRWSGRRFQPQNLKRPDEKLDINTAIDVIYAGDYDLMSIMYEQPLGVIADILRGLLIAAPGHRFIAADYSNIEGRVLAWLAGETWKVDAFREFDEGVGADLYIKSYAETFSVPLFDKKDARRQVGKVMELASGYQGGHGAYIKFGMVGTKLDQLTEIIRGVATDEEWGAAEMRHNGGHELSKEHWTALRITIDRWRAKHPAISSFWPDMENAAINAVLNRGQSFRVGKITFKVSGSSLTMKLPSGRHVFYARPEIRMIDLPWDEREPVWIGPDGKADGTTTQKRGFYTLGFKEFADMALASPSHTAEQAQQLYGDKLVDFDEKEGRALVYVPAKKEGLTYMSEIDDSRRGRIVPDRMNTSKYARIKTYGGSLVENCVQATARDVMADAMPRLEAAGYPIVLSVHDELVCEVPDGHGSVKEMEAIMCDLPEWARGLPVAAEGFEDVRYRK